MNTIAKITATAATAAVSITLLAACAPTPGPASAGTEAPQACIDALDNAEDLQGLLVDALDSASRAMEASSRFDATAIEDENDYISDLTPQVGDARIAYDNAAAECRGE